MIWLMVFFVYFGDHFNVIQREETAIAKISLNEFRKYAAPLVQAEERLDYKSGQVIFYERHKPYGVYVLRKGRIRLFRKKEGVEKLVRIVVPSHILGADEVREMRPFEFGAKAETDVSLSFFSQSAFRETATLTESVKSEFRRGKKKKP